MAAMEPVGTTGAMGCEHLTGQVAKCRNNETQAYERQSILVSVVNHYVLDSGFRQTVTGSAAAAYGRSDT